MGKYTLCLASIVLALAAFECVVGYPRYIAIPIEDVAFLDALPHRHRRAAQAPGPAFAGGNRRFNRPQQQFAPAGDRGDGPIDGPIDDAPNDGRFERNAAAGYGGGRYVDYGAYTGSKGAFGWYTDHPVGKGGY